MAVGNFTLYDSARLHLFNGQLNLAADTIAVALLGPGYTPSAAHEKWSDMVAHEIDDVGYEQKALSGQTATLTGGTVTVDSADISFGANVTLTAKYAVFVQGTAGAVNASDDLVGYVDLDTSTASATVSSTNALFSVNTPNGLFTSP